MCFIRWVPLSTHFRQFHLVTQISMSNFKYDGNMLIMTDMCRKLTGLYNKKYSRSWSVTGRKYLKACCWLRKFVQSHIHSFDHFKLSISQHSTVTSDCVLVSNRTNAHRWTKAICMSDCHDKLNQFYWENNGTFWKYF